MTIYSLFDSEFEITDGDRDRLSNIATSWTRLHDTLNELDELDVKKLIVIEREGSNRPHITRRLRSRLVSLKRARYLQETDRHA